MDIKNYDIKGTTKCDCGHNFTMKDYIELKALNLPGFYGNNIKHYSPAKCPNCHRETLLLLKQAGQTYKIIDIATRKQEAKVSTIKNKTQKETTQGFICPTCKKVCKSQIGLNSHIKTHNK